MTIYRSFFEGKGWSPDRLNAMTPKQLAGIAGGGNAKRQSFGSMADAVAAFEAKRGD